MKDAKDVERAAYAKEGFVYVGEHPIKIWNESDEKSIKIKNVARDSSNVESNLLVTIQIENPIRWIKSGDPILDVAERARFAFRTAISYFTGIDCGLVKALLNSLMVGKIIVTSFIKEQVGSTARWSMIQDHSGGHLFREVTFPEDKTAEEAIEEAKRKFVENELKRAHPDMLEQIMDKKAGKDSKGKDIERKPVVEVRSIEHHLIDVIEGVGARLKRVSIGDFTLSDEVAKQANIAAGEAFQLEAQVKSAQAVRAARKILADAETENPASELATVLAAGQDNPNVKVIYVPGADRLTRAAAVLGANKQGE